MNAFSVSGCFIMVTDSIINFISFPSHFGLRTLYMRRNSNMISCNITHCKNCQDGALVQRNLSFSTWPLDKRYLKDVHFSWSLNRNNKDCLHPTALMWSSSSFENYPWERCSSFDFWLRLIVLVPIANPWGSVNTIMTKNQGRVIDNSF